MSRVMPKIAFVVRDFTHRECVEEIVRALNDELPHLTFRAEYVNLSHVHDLKDGRTVVQDNCTNLHPWGAMGIRVLNESLSRSTLSALLSRAQRAGWDVVVGRVRLSAYPEMVWRRLSLWEEYPRYTPEMAGSIAKN